MSVTDSPRPLPINVFAEMTPNPATMKFVSDKLLITAGEVAEYLSGAVAKGSSPLAEQLFQFPFVKGVFIAANFVTITKSDIVAWDEVMLEIRIFIKEFLESGQIPVTLIPEAVAGEEGSEASSLPGVHGEANTDEEKEIVNLLEEYVRPAVESDGGAIHFKSFKEGTVTVTLRGACSGCPSSTATLKGGIEALLKNHLPTVREVVAKEL